MLTRREKRDKQEIEEYWKIKSQKLGFIKFTVY